MFLLSESAWTLAYVSLAMICVQAFGLDGAGMAFFGAYALHIVLNYWLTRRLSGFRWSAENIRAGGEFLALIGVAFGAFMVLPGRMALLVGIVLLGWSVVRSVRMLLKLVSLDRVPTAVVRLLMVLRLAPLPTSGSGSVPP